MSENDQSMQNIIDFINTIPSEPEKYGQEGKKKYYHNLSYYQIEYDVDKLNQADSKNNYCRYLESQIKARIKTCIIRNINELYKSVGFSKRFEELPTEQDYSNVSDFSKFLNIYDLGIEDSEDNDYRFILQEIITINHYLHPYGNYVYNKELFSIKTLALMPEEFDTLINMILDYKKESEQLKGFKTWAEIYQSLN